MKFGELFERESVPRWSLHNIDYNSLKYQIKTHTTKNQVKAIATRGAEDTVLQKFENGLYHELCRQHDRVGLFVSSKADEINRRLRHLAGLVHSLLVQCTDSRGVSRKRQKKFAKYQQQIGECGDDIRDLERFVNAQTIAFHKILKKYKKWTGSTTLSSRFRNDVLSTYKTFTKRDFHPLQTQHRELLATLNAASPGTSSPAGPADRDNPQDHSNRTSTRPSHSDYQTESRRPSRTPTLVLHRQEASQPPRYWNEYDNGSEAGGDDDDGYAIYINPSESETFPGMDKLRSMFSTPVNTIRSIISRSSGRTAECRSLLHDADSPTDYFGIRVRQSSRSSDNEVTDNEDTSSTEYPSTGYATHYAALPSIEEQRVERYRERVHHHLTVGGFAVAAVLLMVAGVLVATGRHKMRLEVDAAATLSIVASLGASCLGLGGMLYRHDALGFIYKAVAWVAFIGNFVLNVMLLVLIVGSNGL
ncbi:uncharacterized protein BCR38DRAFT_335529 [Pseudomassariella vexata]|uniref:SPX domain-containing protein n=1 Tax=Pseudomassariella vexata TaxID=1141098 RepID=A0A1Y2EB70_9PEZI|nr:uncharacterized protein BCR38DRAFT_335529 [Pseudomassariella vexata]ORY68810.1 hypothetical protein BCR38DRAFT_335529 [Pseudomassariella vexata]